MPIYEEYLSRHIQGYLKRDYNPLIGTIGGFREEFRFIMRYAQQTGGPVLELACGGGRVILALATLGYRVYGIDASAHMLRFGMAARGELESQETQERITYIRADMRSFQFTARFPLIIIPYHSFWLNLDESGAEQCLERIMEHLAPKGFFLIENPRMYGFWEQASIKLKFQYTLEEYYFYTRMMLVGQHA